MRKAKDRKRFSRATHFRSIFKNSPPYLRRVYWILAILFDLLGFFFLFSCLSYFYSYLSLYLTSFWLCHLSIIVFFLVLGILGFFFHATVTLTLLTFFYKCYDKRRRKS